MPDSTNICSPAAYIPEGGWHLAVYKEVPAEPEFRKQWNALVHSMESPEVFYTWEWAEAVSRAYGDSLSPMLLATFRDKVLVGIAALCLSDDRDVSFLSANTADYCDFVSSPENRAEFLRMVLAELKKMAIRGFQFANIPADSCSIPALPEAARACGYNFFSRAAYLCRQLVMKSQEDRLRTSQAADGRCKRAIKKLAAMGKVAVIHSAGREELATELQNFAVAHIGRFLSEDRISNIISSERRHFLAELASLLSEQDWLRLSRVQLDSGTIAWNYGMIFAGKWFWYQPAFDVRWQRAAPGTYLLSEIIRAAAQNPEVNVLDLGLGDETYKQRYSEGGRQTLSIVGTRSGARLKWTICRYYCSTLLKRSSRVENAIRKTISVSSQYAGQGVAGRFLKFLEHTKQYFHSQLETVFFEWDGSSKSARIPAAHLSARDPTTLRTLSFEILAKAAMQYESDTDTTQYLLRCARRLNSGQAEGFALMSAEDIPIHFCWTKPFEDCWIAGVGHKLNAPAPQSVMLFDCWTPATLRGCGYYQECISRVASTLLQTGAKPWIFTDPHNQGSLRGILSAGFAPRFSFLRRKMLGLSRLSRVEFTEKSGTRIPGRATAA